VAGEHQEEAVMVLNDILREIVEKVGGGMGSVIMGYDGIPIDEYIKEGAIDVQILAVEYANVLKEVKRTIEVLKTGDMEEIIITTGLSKVIIHAISDDFFIMLALSSDGNYGKGRYLLKRDVPKLLEELR
jgi:predicted regulator of Ras-like GTPase activity (Roadblock/LC7/MglB family)